MEQAIRAAREGYVVSDGLATTLATEREHYERSPGAVVDAADVATLVQRSYVHTSSSTPAASATPDSWASLSSL